MRRQGWLDPETGLPFYPGATEEGNVHKDGRAWRRIRFPSGRLVLEHLKQSIKIDPELDRKFKALDERKQMLLSFRHEDRHKGYTTRSPGLAEQMNVYMRAHRPHLKSVNSDWVRKNLERLEKSGLFDALTALQAKQDMRFGQMGSPITLYRVEKKEGDEEFDESVIERVADAARVAHQDGKVDERAMARAVLKPYRRKNPRVGKSPESMEGREQPRTRKRKKARTQTPKPKKNPEKKAWVLHGLENTLKDRGVDAGLLGEAEDADQRTADETEAGIMRATYRAIQSVQSGEQKASKRASRYGRDIEGIKVTRDSPVARAPKP